jgi:hypothetical protein
MSQSVRLSTESTSEPPTTHLSNFASVAVTLKKVCPQRRSLQAATEEEPAGGEFLRPGQAQMPHGLAIAANEHHRQGALLTLSAQSSQSITNTR